VFKNCYLLIFDIVSLVAYNWVSYNLSEGVDLTSEKDPSVVAEEQAQDIERIKRRLDMLDQRLDNIDSVVTAVAERVLKQPITLNITCPHCGKNIEIAIIGNRKPTR